MLSNAIMPRCLLLLRRSPVSFMASAKPTPMIGPIKGDMSIAPMTTGIEFTFSPTLAMIIANMRIHTLLPRNSMFPKILFRADSISMLSEKFMKCFSLSLVDSLSMTLGFNVRNQMKTPLLPEKGRGGDKYCEKCYFL